MSKTFKSLVKIIRTKTKGVIPCRSKAVEYATGEVLVFLESEIEVGYNWLPPLLSPIKNDYTTVLSPILDKVDASTFEYKSVMNFGRGAFDWNFDFKKIPLQDDSKENPEKNYETPIFTGSMFVISRKFYDEIHGYDIGLNNEGGEVFDMSFKIWLCGGQILNVPCSRIGQISKHINSERYLKNEVKYFGLI